MLLSRLIKRRNTLPPVRLRRQKAPPPPDRLERLSKLVNVFGVTLPLSAVLYGGFQIYLDYQKHQDEMQLKSIELATTLTTLRAEGKLSLENEVFMLRTLRSLPIDEQMDAVVEKQLSQAQEVVEVKQRLVSAEAESQRLEGQMLELQRETDKLTHEKALLEVKIQKEAQGLGSRTPGKGPLSLALEAELAKLKEELRLASERELRSVKQFAEAQETIREQRAALLELQPSRATTNSVESVPASGGEALSNKPEVSLASVKRSFESSFPADPRVLLLPGDQITLEGRSFGSEPGGVYVCDETSCVPLQITSWTDDRISAEAKELGNTHGEGYTVVVGARGGSKSSPIALDIWEVGD